MAAVTLPALSNHLPEFQGSHPYIQQEYQFPGALGGLQIRAAKPGISAELCSRHRSWNFSWLGCLLGGCREVGFCLSCNQTGLAKRCQRLPGLSPAPWHPEERGSRCERQRGGQLPPWSVQGHGAVLGCPPGAEPTSQQHHGWWDPAQEKRARAMQPREGHFLRMFLSQMRLLKSTEKVIPLQPGDPSCPHSSLGPSKELRNPIPINLL